MDSETRLSVASSVDELLNLSAPCFPLSSTGIGVEPILTGLLRAFNMFFWRKVTERGPLAIIFISHGAVICPPYLLLNSRRSRSTQNSSLYSPKESLLCPHNLA